MAIDRRAARLSTLGFVGLALFGILGIRLWFLQTVESEALREDFVASSTRTVYIPPLRGRIFDLDGRILADNTRVLTLGIDPQTIRNEDKRRELFTRLSGWLEIPASEMEAEWQKGLHSQYLPFVVKTDVDEDVAIAIQERSEDFPGVEIGQAFKRVYPYAPIASHIVGYMGSITPEQFEDYLDRGYQANERVGQFGVERGLEDILHGKWGSRTVEIDAAGRQLQVLHEVEPVDGFDVQLTIDLDLQQYLEQNLQSTLRARRTTTARNPNVRDPFTKRLRIMDPDSPRNVYFPAPAGSSVVMNYLTGEVVALASYPDFDNRWFESGVSGAKIQEVFPSTDKFGNPIDPDKSILVNRAVQGRYNVGSTAKPFTAFAGLNSGIVGAYSYYTDTGIYRLESVSADKCDTVRCEYRNSICGATGKPCVYGPLNVSDALAVSSDAFFYRIGERSMIGENKGKTIMQDNARNFGFGSKTGIELPFEYSGAVPDKALKRQYAESGAISAIEGSDYFTGDNVQFSIGQGLFATTPLQLANGYAALANGGFLLQPTLVKQIFEPGTPDADEPARADLARGVVFEHEARPPLPVVRSRVPMEEEDRVAVMSGLRRVVVGPGANGKTPTGEKVFFDTRSWPIQIGGKTGTAQGFGNFPWFDTSVFVGYAQKGVTQPDQDNPYVVAALLEKSGYGAVAAAPVVKCVFSVLSGVTNVDPVVPSDPLDISSTEAAPERYLAEDGGGVYAQPKCWSRFQEPSSVYKSSAQGDARAD